MLSQKVVSREYKLVLKAANFAGGRDDLLQKASGFWRAVKKAIAALIKETDGDLNTIVEEREIKFYDTKELTLNKRDYIFRQRQDLPDGKTELTLKFRHPDRYVSQGRDMAMKSPKGKTKFEEDIKAPFLKLYSFSAGQKLAEDTKLKKLKHVIKLYPGLAEHFDGQLAEEPIEIVGNTTIHEIVIGEGHIVLSNEPAGKAECALIVWYGADDTNPVIVEFSFRYKDDNENYPRVTAHNAYDLFLLLQDKLKEWIDADGGTKTGFIFGL